MVVKITSLFSGIGGFELGLLRAMPSAEVVFSSEIDEYARQIYKKNFGVEPYGDITKIKAEDVPDHDILCGGFPCQAFSVAGKRRGFQDTRGTLFFEIVRIAEAKRPKLLFLENVRGLLSHDSGRTIQTILRSLDDVGYDAEWQLFNSKDHGVPQNRQRVFLIGHLRGSGTRPIFPITKSERPPDQEKPLVYCLDTNYGKGPARSTRTMILCDSGHGRKNQLRNETIPSLRANTGAGHNNNVVVHSTFPRTDTSGNGGCGHLKREDGLSYCCDTSNSMAIQKHDKIRRLMPIECERLQGFPDGWTDGISDTQRYKCLGNAVTVNVIEFIAEHIDKMLKEDV